MNRVASAAVTGAGVLIGGFVGAMVVYERRPRPSRGVQDVGMLAGALIGGMIAGAATAEPAPKQTGVSGVPRFEPRWP